MLLLELRCCRWWALRQVLCCWLLLLLLLLLAWVPVAGQRGYNNSRERNRAARCKASGQSSCRGQQLQHTCSAVVSVPRRNNHAADAKGAEILSVVKVLLPNIQHILRHLSHLGDGGQHWLQVVLEVWLEAILQAQQAQAQQAQQKQSQEQHGRDERPVPP
jgi:hypothetical protein